MFTFLFHPGAMVTPTPADGFALDRIHLGLEGKYQIPEMDFTTAELLESRFSDELNDRITMYWTASRTDKDGTETQVSVWNPKTESWGKWETK